MLKKTKIILVSLCFTLLLVASVGSLIVFRDNFSFKNITTNIQESSGIGLAKNLEDSKPNNPGRKFQSSPVPAIQYDKLISVDESGEVEIVSFFNNNGQEVEIPFHPILIEPYGDFVYIVYSDWSKEYHDFLNSNQNQIKYLFWYVYQDYAFNNNRPFQYEFITIHKPSGKVFDLKESIIDVYAPSKKLTSSLVYLLDGFAFTTEFLENDNSVCINRGIFNNNTEVMDFTQVCSEIIFNIYGSPTHVFALPNGDIRLQDNSEYGNRVINLYSFQTTRINDLDENTVSGYYFSRSSTPQVFFLSRDKIMAIGNTGSEHYLLEMTFSEKTTEFVIKDFPSNLRIDDLLVGRNAFSESPIYVFSKFNNYTNNEVPLSVLKVYPKDLSYELIIENLQSYFDIDYNSINLYLLNFESILYIIRNGFEPSIYEISLETSNISKIFDSDGIGFFKQHQTRNRNYFFFGQEFYPIDTFYLLKTSGNYYFKIVENLSEVTYKFNLYSKKIFEEAQSTPTYTFYEIIPIN